MAINNSIFELKKEKIKKIENILKIQLLNTKLLPKMKEGRGVNK
ncbi:MAG: hypothetical protein NT118_02120 [Lentisphaerae bacterium]|nr:hypothetical protein [Lentisphaerota bacterium]